MRVIYEKVMRYFIALIVREIFCQFGAGVFTFPILHLLHAVLDGPACSGTDLSF